MMMITIMEEKRRIGKMEIGKVEIQSCQRDALMLLVTQMVTLVRMENKTEKKQELTAVGLARDALLPDLFHGFFGLPRVNSFKNMSYNLNLYILCFEECIHICLFLRCFIY